MIYKSFIVFWFFKNDMTWNLSYSIYKDKIEPKSMGIKIHTKKIYYCLQFHHHMRAWIFMDSMKINFKDWLTCGQWYDQYNHILHCKKTVNFIDQINSKLFLKWWNSANIDEVIVHQAIEFNCALEFSANFKNAHVCISVMSYNDCFTL